LSIACGRAPDSSEEGGHSAAPLTDYSPPAQHEGAHPGVLRAGRMASVAIDHYFVQVIFAGDERNPRTTAGAAYDVPCRGDDDGVRCFEHDDDDRDFNR
jgi:hypothetical protein